LKPGSRPHRIKNDRRSLWKHRLLQGIGRPTDASVFKALLKSSRDLLVLPKLTPEKFGDDFACEIIAGRSEAAAADHNISQSLGLAQRPQELIFVVADLQNRRYLNSYGEKALGDRWRIRVNDSSGDEFIAGAQDHGLLNHIKPNHLIAAE
jgi:hypothetical protein